mmetsp:Transcript_7356/g.16676  ORF Transcript_7356/g.16676 Transcript_7356/m.16676 type:complete len:95 (-) Transcript_7356:1092-1376(-)
MFIVSFSFASNESPAFLRHLSYALDNFSGATCLLHLVFSFDRKKMNVVSSFSVKFKLDGLWYRDSCKFQLSSRGDRTTTDHAERSLYFHFVRHA